jgi:hypothetical protein
MEIEVVSFDRCEAISENPERALEILHKRQYLPYFIRNEKGEESTDETRYFYNLPEKNKAELEGKKGKPLDFKNQYYLQQFFTKMPTSFRQSSCNSDRLIFRAGSRSTWVYDLKMEKGYLRLFGQDDI